MAEYIEREAAVKSIMQKERHDFPTDYFPDDEYAFNDGLVVAANALDEVRAADVVPVVRCGEWVEENTRPRSSQFYCSVCHRTAYDPQPTRSVGWVKRCRYHYCPNCGAKMDTEAE